MNKGFPRAYPPSYPRIQDLLPCGTVLYLDMEDRGGVAVDHSGNKNNVTWIWNQAHSKLYGGSVYLGGTSYGTILNSTSMDIIKPPLTILAWANMSQAATGSGYIISKNNTSPSDEQYGMFIDNTTLKFSCLLNGTFFGSANNTIKLGTWYLIGMVWDGAKVQLYINGLPSGNPTAYSVSTLTSQPYLRIGRRETVGGVFKGNIGEIWVIKNTLKPADVKALFRETAWKYGVNE